MNPFLRPSFCRTRAGLAGLVPPIVSPAALLSALLLLVTGCDRFKKAAPVEFKTEAAVRTNMVQSVSANGGIAPIRQVQVGSQISGTITEMKVDFNSAVKEGDVLARIDPATYERALARAKADLANATAGLALAEFNAKRAKELFASKLISETEFQQADVALLQAQAGVKTREAAVESAQVDLDRTTIYAPISGVVVTRSVDAGQTVAASFNTPTLFVLAEDLSAMQLRVAIDEADVGQVAPGQTAKFAVDAWPGRQFPATVERIDLASKNTATTASASQSQASQADAVVSYEARLAVANTGGLLRPGMTATATIATRNTGTQLLVPNGALRFDPDAEEETTGGGLDPQIGLKREEQKASIGVGSRQRVQVLQADGTLKAVEVVTGQSDGRYTVVTAGALKPGMKVVTGVRAEKKP